MDRIRFELRQTLRGLARNPALTLSAALALALGVGATTTLYSIVRGATRTLPFEDAEQLLVLTRMNAQRGWSNQGARAFDVLAWQKTQESFEGLAAFSMRSVNLAGDGKVPERVDAAAIEPGAFALIGARPALGRLFTDADARAGAAPVVLIGDGIWRSRLARDPAVLGRTLRVNGVAHTVIGVLPPGFGFPVNQAVWLPLALNASAGPADGDWFTVFGRLREGVTVEAAQAEFSTIAAGLASAAPATHAGSGIRALPFVELEMDRDVLPVLYIMLLAVSFVLLIACANVANLLLARAATRSREVAIRVALGAGRRRIVLQHLLESLAIAVAGGLAGILFAHVAVGFFDRTTADILSAFWLDFRVDGAVLLFALVAVALAGIVAGLLPALRTASLQPTFVLKESTASGLRIGRLSRTLVVAELTLACGLLIVSGMLVQAAIRLRAAELPFPDREIYSAQIGVSDANREWVNARASFLRNLTDQLQSIPGLRAVGFASVLPGRGAGMTSFTADGQNFDRPEDRPSTGVVLVTPGYFDVLNAAAVRGRLLSWSDDEQAPRVAVVNQSWVRRFSAERDPIGRILRVREDAPATIVGVVPDLQMQDPGDPRGDGIYLPMLQREGSLLRVIAQSAGPVLGLTPQIRARLARIDPDLPIFEIATLHDAIASENAVLDTFGTLFALFGAAALFLTIVGLYGVVSFGVVQRTREYGVRMSLGARRPDILRLVILQGGTPLFIGAALGLGLGYVLARAIGSFLEQMPGPTVEVFGSVLGALLVTAFCALIVPAWRAAAVDPQRALRAE